MNDITGEFQNVLSDLITSKTRLRILMRLFLNPQNTSYLRGLAVEIGVSPSIVKEELHQLTKAGLLKSQSEGRKIWYRANTQHTLFPELHSMVKKALGMDRIVESIVARLGNLEKAMLLDDYAEGKDTGIIDLMLIGDINRKNLRDLVRKTEHYIGRKIRTLVLSREEAAKLTKTLARRSTLELWNDESKSR